MKDLSAFLNEALIFEKRKAPIPFTGDIYNIDEVIDFLEQNYKVHLKPRTGKKDLMEALEKLAELDKEFISIYNDRMGASFFKDGMSKTLIEGKYSISVQTNDMLYYHWDNDDKKWSLYEFEF